MKIIASNHAADYRRPDSAGTSIRETLFLDGLGEALRGVYGEMEGEPLPDSLAALAALLDPRGDRGDPA
ncbi:hypothetical protein [Methylobacterium sp. sgz302541]|uniref:hypothetical protein n=1 Tax=unclassified Methylobacterium TaxID=2615210 RepID=UPI003D330414